MKKGFSLIDVLVGTVLVLVVFLGIFGAYQLSLKVIGQSKARITATALANQKIELVRNLPYSDVGTVGGIPAGMIPGTEAITRNNIAYTVKTTIVYIDDPFDGIIPADTLPRDYKRTKVSVSWAGRFSGEVVLMTDISPQGVESEAGGGTLSISAFDALGIDVPQANLHLVNPQVSPPIDAWYQTDNYGDLILAGAPASVDGYQITATKSGYSADRTYSTGEVTNPLKPHQTVFEGKLTEISFSIDRLSSLLVKTTGTKGQGYPPVKNVAFKLEGEKIIGTDSQGNPVYKYSQNHLTGSSGEIEIANLEWDSYNFSVDKTTTDLDLVDTESPFGATTTQPVELLPNTNQAVRLILKAENSLLVTVKDASTTEPIFGASVNLSNSELGYSVTQPTYQDGRTFFIPLASANYLLAVGLTGYESSTSTISVAGDSAEMINLIPSLP